MALSRTLIKQLSIHVLRRTRTVIPNRASLIKAAAPVLVTTDLSKLFKSAMTSDAPTDPQQCKIDASVSSLGDNGPEVVRTKVLAPPSRKEMRVLDKAAFDKEMEVPTITVLNSQVRHVVSQLKPYLLKAKVRNFPNIIPVENSDSKKLLLDPDKVTDLHDFFANKAPNVGLDPALNSSSALEKVTFTYEQWSYREILDAILPDDKEKFSGYSATGHVVHVNLKDHLLPFKQVIGEVLLDKIPYARTVVNKLEQIDSVYRNFQMDFLAGDHDTVVTLRENKCTFQFDFATVYWNSRLSTEHERIVNLLDQRSVVFDVFAGVGPFAIPAAVRKKCLVLANDLNPESAKWLAINVELNKVSERVRVFNKDGREFIREDVAQHLAEALRSPEFGQSLHFHVIMNLPAIAVEFLNAFWGLLGTETVASSLPPAFRLTVHVYCFVKDIANYEERALAMVKESLSFDLAPEDVGEVSRVRNVAPNKEMLRVSFDVPTQILISKNSSSVQPEGGCGVKRKLAEVE